MRLPALRNLLRPLFFLLAVFFASGRLWAQEETAPQWYRSNKSGLAIERMPSRLAAIREEYSLRVRNVSFRDTPEILSPYYNTSFTIEERILFEKGDEARLQWIFRDQRGRTRLNASFSPGFFSSWVEPEVIINDDEDGEENDNEDDENVSEAKPEEKTKSGFIEIFDERLFITEERVFSQDGSESQIRFFYNMDMLTRTENRKRVIVQHEAAPEIVMLESSFEEEFPADTDMEDFEEPGPKDELVLQFVDYYRYTRANYIRAVERVYHTVVAEDNNRLRLSFPVLSPGTVPAIEFEVPHMPFDFGGDDSFEVPQGDRVTYTTDSRGRALREIRRDEDGNILGEIENSWSGDRLSLVRITAGDEERIVEFEYDSEGNRIMERNFRNGILERTVRSSGDRDTEELYMDGVLVLRAVWEGGRKISEERVRPASGASEVSR